MEYKKKKFWEAHPLNKNTESTKQIDTTKLETEDEKTARIRSLWVINIQTFIFALSFSIVITGVLPYLRQVRYIVPKCSQRKILIILKTCLIRDQHVLIDHYFQLLPGDTEDEIILKYSTIVAVNPLAQMIFAPIFGYLYNKIGAVRPLGISAAVIFIIGNLLYSILSLIPSENGRYALLLLSRFLTGASAGRFDVISRNS